MADDQRLAAAVGGDQDALVALLKHHSEEVRQHVAVPRRWQSLLSLDDVMQQTYVDAFRDIHRFVPRGEGAFPAWLKRLAHHNLLDAIKLLEAQKRGAGHRAIQPAGRDDSCAALYEMLSASSMTAGGKVARKEAVSFMGRAVEHLPPTYRLVVEMYDLQQRPVEEVAAALGRSAGAVYMLRTRAHRLLAELMGRASKYLSGTA